MTRDHIFSVAEGPIPAAQVCDKKLAPNALDLQMFARDGLVSNAYVIV